MYRINRKKRIPLSPEIYTDPIRNDSSHYTIYDIMIGIIYCIVIDVIIVVVGLLLVCAIETTNVYFVEESYHPNRSQCNFARTLSSGVPNTRCPPFVLLGETLVDPAGTIVLNLGSAKSESYLHSLLRCYHRCDRFPVKINKSGTSQNSLVSCI